MLKILCQEETYVYNAYHMGKAFYPSEPVEASAEEKASHYVVLYLPSGKTLALDEESGAKEERSIRKRRMDRKLYQALARETGRSLAWGILTGVRPTKIAMGKREEGLEGEAFLTWFEETYLVSPRKARLAYEIAGREQALLERLDYQDGYSLYVGIPFCPSVCTYCSFSSGSLEQWGGYVEPYLAALHKELEWISRACREKKLNTIYFGGGTPTSLSAGQLDRLLGWVDELFSREHLLEYTVEAGRPDSIDREKLKVLRSHEVTRISINPQSMQQKTLDLIAGLPGEKTGDMKDTLEKIRALDPDSLTVHSLAVKRAARMGQEGYIPGGEEIGDMLDLAAETARAMGMSPYYLYRQKNIAGNFENTGYAKVDKAGIYNILIMEEKQSIIAAGAGASTKIVLKEPVPSPEGRGKKTNLIRQENVKAIDAYVRRVDEMIERKGEWL